MVVFLHIHAQTIMSWRKTPSELACCTRASDGVLRTIGAVRIHSANNRCGKSNAFDLAFPNIGHAMLATSRRDFRPMLLQNHHCLGSLKFSAHGVTASGFHGGSSSTAAPAAAVVAAVASKNRNGSSDSSSRWWQRAGLVV